MYYQTILETIGNTPLVRLNQITKDIPATVVVKIESFNPGHSIKDRIGLRMVEDAEEKGLLKPGGTIIECTSGNTGMGIALAAIIKGYQCIFTTNDKQSKEKIDILKAMGAEVVVCPTSVAADDPRSYYSVAEKLNKEIPNSFWANQYDNLSNREAHYETTGPELWEQTDGKITHLVAGVGTGGTISGMAKFLKEQNPNIKIWGIDTYGSVFKKYHETGEFDEKEIYPYITEGIGEDILPANVDFSLIDHFEKVTDKDGAVMSRRLAREEGLLVGYSCGSAVAGLVQMKDSLNEGDFVVVILPDHGSRYIAKVYNDEWMHERGFLETGLTVSDLLQRMVSQELLSIDINDKIGGCLKVMKERDISQMPVTEDQHIVGSITESALLNFILENPEEHKKLTVREIMDSPFPVIDDHLSCKQLSNYISKNNPAVLVRKREGGMQILTKYDIIHAL